MIAFLWVLLSLVIAVLVHWHWRKKVAFARNIPRLEPCYPIVGNLPLALMKNSNQIFIVLHDFFRTHNRLFTLRCGPLVAIGVTNPDLIQKVLNHPDCQQKPDLYKVVRLPGGLLAAKYETWKKHRKTLNSTFNLRILNSFLPIFNDCSRKLIDRLSFFAETDESCNILEYISECTLEMISRTSLGGKAMERKGKQEFIENLKVALNALGKRILNVLLHSDFIYRFTQLYYNEMKAIAVCHQFTDKIIAEKRTEIGTLLHNNGNVIESDANYKRPQIFIDQLMKMPLKADGVYSFSNREISDHIYTMIVAGNETSATQLSHTCLLLAMYPDIQERAYREVRNIITSPVMEINIDDLKQLVYIEAVIKEAMRLIPVAPIIARENLRDIELDGHHIPKGTLLMMNFYSLHRRKELWGPFADHFDPEHFLEDAAMQTRHPYAYLPFSGGPRGCIGYRYAMMSLKLALALILKNFRLTTEIKYDQIQYQYQISLNLALPHTVSLKRRL
ncbi:probable cytochrome P450 313a4 [Toxorhynchites rutilus septentrionalis]|uniref:probable cytochrome P450 313a4 n=1 Tax=Toxorhynchites rutilus septentrionalis TaxID=329112 RepID=UPI00247A09AF|nr:probable cytochrome P450 313a4 [Toxorhynchites rutilus septentrionalis]